MINKILSRLIPFFFLGIMAVVFVVGIILFSYLLIWGALVGLVLFLIAWVKEKFFPSRDLTVHQKPKSSSGRIIDHEDHQDNHHDHK